MSRLCYDRTEDHHISHSSDRIITKYAFEARPIYLQSYNKVCDCPAIQQRGTFNTSLLLDCDCNRRPSKELPDAKLRLQQRKDGRPDGSYPICQKDQGATFLEVGALRDVSEWRHEKPSVLCTYRVDSSPNDV